MVVVNLHGHYFRDSKMASARAVSPYIGVAVMLGVTWCHPRAESGPLGTTGTLVPVGSNQCCLESMSMKSKKALFTVSPTPGSTNFSESVMWLVRHSINPPLQLFFLPINDFFCGWCNVHNNILSLISVSSRSGPLGLNWCGQPSPKRLWPVAYYVMSRATWWGILSAQPGKKARAALVCPASYLRLGPPDFSSNS